MKKIIVTHNGSFHSDDVFAVSVLCLFFGKGNVEILRSRDQKIIDSADFVLDVGGKYDGGRFFDHHQIGGAGVRENGVPFATFGLVWKKFGEKLCGSKVVADIIDKDLVQFIDAGDSGVGELKPFFGDVMPFTFVDVIKVLNYERLEKQEDDLIIFKYVVSFAERVLFNEIESVKKNESEKEEIIKIYKETENKSFLVFDKIYDWANILKDFKDVFFVVEPEDNNLEGKSRWKIKCVRDNPNSFINRKDLPKVWAGLQDEELSKISGISDALFCHNACFMAIAKSKEGAIKIVEKAFLL